MLLYEFHVYIVGKWFDKQKSYLDSLESQLRGLVKAIELVARQRSGMCVTMYCLSD